MNVLDAVTRKQIVACLVEGNSIRATCRLTGAAKGTVLKLLADLGAACRAYHDAHVRNLKCRRVQCDEIWSFVGAKDKNVLPDEEGFGRGSIWTWTAIDAETKLIAAYHVGTRDAGCAYEFMTDLASRISTRIQLTTDGHKAYLNAVADAFGPSGVDYAMLVKLYGEVPPGAARYSPPQCIGANLNPIMGAPEMEHVSTSHVERQNLTMRMSMRRFTRLTNGFSKKVENLEHAVAIHFMHYNFCRVHQTLRVTPAMAAGVSDHVWEIDDLIAIMPKPVARPWGSVKRAAGPT
ncbi:MAG TPA: DDE-type integrase/transposase/recombinase [Polyangiaceae bacterium]|jgi:IS1 family transposase